MEHGTGALKDKKDKRDYKYKDAVIALGIVPFDWDKGYDIEENLGIKLTIKDQDGSGSCGGQAWGYYGQSLDPDQDEKSAKFIYSQTFIPPAGSDGRTNCQLVIDKGWGTEKLTSSYENSQPPSEKFMQRKEDITSQAFSQALTDKALSYANVGSDINLIAQAVRENKGCVIGLTGKNNGTWSSAFPLPPSKVDNTCWNHWLYVGKAKVINGKKYLGVCNSWGNIGQKGWQWIPEEYVKYPFVWSCWTLVYNFPKFIFTKTLKMWSWNNDVKELQKRLGCWQDGIFGPITRRAVKLYQSKHHLTVDGIVGKNTNAVLNGGQV